MKFSQMPYARPNLAKQADVLQNLADKAQNCKEEKELLEIFQSFQTLMDEVTTAATLASIHHTMDTKSKFYNEENDYYDENSPIIFDKSLSLYRAILANPKKECLEKAYGKILLEKMEIAAKSSQASLVKFQQQENALATQYEKLYAAACINFDGGQFTVAQLAPFKQSTNRSLRKQAFEAEGGFFDENREELDEIYEKLVKNRTQQANILGYTSFTPLGDIRMQRHGYTRKNIAACRSAVASGIVPFAQKLKTLSAARIGVDDFKYYDDLLSFADGNPRPKGTPEEILAAGQSMYQGLSQKTAGFINFMMDGELFDVLAKPGKAPGGYCTYIPLHKSPFIFSNFNGTAGDIDVLTHEAGHAFAAFLAAEKNLPEELRAPGLESCEIHSMSMEFLTGDFHHLFFGSDTDKYSIAHAEDSLFFMPYGCQVDEYQEEVYNRPGLTPQQRNQLWLELEKKYRPWNDFAGLPFYSRGAGWQRQMHIYGSPFYYIDYVLAQAIALQFFLAHKKDPKDAFERYLALTEKAGCETYCGLVKAAGMQTPFEDGALNKVGKQIYQWVCSELQRIYG